MDKKEIDSLSALELINSGARDHGLEELSSLDDISPEWAEELITKISNSMGGVGDTNPNDLPELEEYPSRQPSFEMMRDFHNLRVKDVVTAKHINWAIKYLGHPDTMLVEEGWSPVVGDVFALQDAIIKFADKQKGEEV